MSFNFNWVSSATGDSLFPVDHNYKCFLSSFNLHLLCQLHLYVWCGERGLLLQEIKLFMDSCGKLSQMKFTVLIIKSSCNCQKAEETA